MKTLLLALTLVTPALLHTSTVPAQTASADPRLEGIWEGYDGEWSHVSQQLIALAEAIPADKYSWRPAPGVRSISEVIMHIAIANFYLLSVTGPKIPSDLTSNTQEETVRTKPEVLSYLKRSLAAVKTARAQVKPADLNRQVKIQGKAVTVDGIYLRIIIHNNEHMGQLIAYARMNGIVPPWSQPRAQLPNNKGCLLRRTVQASETSLRTIFRDRMPRRRQTSSTSS